MGFIAWPACYPVSENPDTGHPAIVGNYHKLSPWHLDRYMREFWWRYNPRRVQESIFDLALTSMVNRVPLPYKSLVAF